MDSDLSELQKQKKYLEELLALEEEILEKKKISKLAKIAYTRFPDVILKVMAILGVLAGVIHYAPLLTNWLVREYSILPGTVLKLFSVTWIGFLVSSCILVMLYWQVGGWFIPPLLSKLRGIPVLDFYTNSRRKKYITPRKSHVKNKLYKIKDYGRLYPEDDDVYIGPNNVLCASAAPEHPTTFNPRKLLMGKKPNNIDMASVDVDAEKAKEEARREFRSGMDQFKPFIGPIVILVTILTIMVIPVIRYTDQSSQVDHWRDEYTRQQQLNSKLSQQVVKLGGEPLDESSVKATKPAGGEEEKKSRSEDVEFPGTGVLLK